MLSYQHGYHAGNFADVVKHLCLTLLLDYLTQKDKPLFYLETHAGKGLYDLNDKQAQKTGEAKFGIELLWQEKSNLPPVFDTYMDTIEAVNPTSQLSIYPGSPTFAMHLLRSFDRIVCCELHPQEYSTLKTINRLGKKVSIEQKNGLEQIKALLPPAEKRGVIFIDPSFEIKDDYRQIPLAIQEGVKRFATGVYCLWYPLVDQQLNSKLTKGLEALSVRNTLNMEFVHTPHGKGMYGCGLWLINPPFILAEKMEIALKTLMKFFNPGKSSFSIKA
ncbi:protein involved in catabolism of external DNA (plasmid) [Legionella adelaidensis]|uniref:Ribosomal RNA large subunit methyltransferase J n=1 Tax=Legionella adelaidensis TaxID=45056 RepID=A0A0W0R276_9GAMM|nr:23S rRNA (adenine(2030)-N(6))-methyltransferase RlmJ [Legionella adelaidensis]KTC65160.1 protein involved in catabolism of external DNA [Legionella adelaidensis]VEH85052.1 protein involved in catabolism of external DNA [Legionella adelaidensis]